MEDIEIKPRKGKRLGKRFLIAISIIVVAVCILVSAAYFAIRYYQNKYGTYTDYEIVKSVENTGGASAKYQAFNDWVLKYTRDGATVVNQDGEYIWNGSYEMIDPMVDTCGKYVVVANRNNKLVHIFDENGPVNNFEVEYPILQVQVANQGVIAVMMEQDNVVYINLYKADGLVRANLIKPIQVAGFPLSMALSNDGQRLIYSSLDATTGKVRTNVACYNFGGVGQNEENYFVGGFIYDSIIAKVDFITNDIACFYRQDGFTVYRFEQKLSKNPIEDITFENKIQSVFSTSSYIGVITEASDDKYKYEICLYNLKGQQMLSKGINYEYSGVSASNTNVILYDYSSCMVISTSGKIRFEKKLDCNVLGIFDAGKGRLYLVQDNSLDLIQLKGAK